MRSIEDKYINQHKNVWFAKITFKNRRCFILSEKRKVIKQHPIMVTFRGAFSFFFGLETSIELFTQDSSLSYTHKNYLIQKYIHKIIM